MIKVLIAEDMQPILKRYQSILEADGGIEVVGAVQSGYEAVLVAGIQKPDVVLMDIEMETKTSGLDATQQILSYLPNTKIVILTVYEDDETVFKAFQLGVSDYILKGSNPREITTCVKDAYHNCSPIRPVIANKIRQEFQRIKNSEKSILYSLHMISRLTPTEMDVLELLSRGYTRAQICEIRTVELSTVKTQIGGILKKFEQSSISELVKQLNESQVFDYLRHIKSIQ